jgi:hypothetical protein
VVPPELINYAQSVGLEVAGEAASQEHTSANMCIIAWCELSSFIEITA